MLKTLLPCIAAVLLTSACALDEDRSDTSQESHAWGSYHWARTSNPFTLKLGDNVTSAWDSYLATASSDWTASSVLNTTIVAGGAKRTSCKATTGRVEVCNSTYGNTGWLGIAGISASGSHITSSYVKLNDTYFNTSTYNTTAWRNMVMCQEVGHAFGLAHQDENFNNTNLNTCMDYTNNPSSNQHPNTHDYNQLESIYAHTDSTTTVGVAPVQDSDEIGLGQDDWGELVFSAQSGVQDTFMRVISDEEVQVTHVFWAPGAHRPLGSDDHGH